MEFSISNVEFDNAWNKMLLQLPEKRIELLEKLNKKFSLFYLVTLMKFTLKLSKNHPSSIGYDRFENCFSSIFSHKSARKPNASCFEMVLSENKLVQKNFIDDSIQHVEGAYKIELKHYLLKVERNLLYFS